MASGNAVKGASTRPVRYPNQVITMLSDEATGYIVELAKAEGLSKSEAVRTLIETGIAERKLEAAGV